MTKSKWILGAALLSLASAAHAHSHLKSSMPADGSTVMAPKQIMLMFSAAARVTALTIQKDGEAEQKLAPLPSEPAAHVMVRAPKLTPGKYTVTYRILSNDNHVMSGKLHFTVSDSASNAGKMPANHGQ